MAIRRLEAGSHAQLAPSAIRSAPTAAASPLALAKAITDRIFYGLRAPAIFNVVMHPFVPVSVDCALNPAPENDSTVDDHAPLEPLLHV
jgi:hypothetical protein